LKHVQYHSVPTELTEAFSAGRFRPFSSVRALFVLCHQRQQSVVQVEVNGRAAPAERLTPSWEFDQTRVLQAFETILSSKVRQIPGSRQ
jgi:hypothetical protein